MCNAKIAVFLDKCAVVEIENYINGGDYNEKWIEELKQFDSSDYKVFSCLAAIEGSRQSQGTHEEKITDIENQILAIETFYKSSELDTLQIRHSIPELLKYEIGSKDNHFDELKGFFIEMALD